MKFYLGLRAHTFAGLYQPGPKGSVRYKGGKGAAPPPPPPPPALPAASEDAPDPDALKKAKERADAEARRSNRRKLTIPLGGTDSSAGSGLAIT